MKKSKIDYVTRENVVESWRKLTPLQQEAVHRWHQGGKVMLTDEVLKCQNAKNQMRRVLSVRDPKHDEGVIKWAKSMMIHWEEIIIILHAFSMLPLYDHLKGQKCLKDHTSPKKPATRR